VDGALEWQLNLRSREALTAVIGVAAVEKLWALAAKHYAEMRCAPLIDRPSCGMRPRCTTEPPPPSAAEGVAALPHCWWIYIRQFDPYTRPWFQFHYDHSLLTVNVALTDDHAHVGGRLLALVERPTDESLSSEGAKVPATTPADESLSSEGAKVPATTPTDESLSSEGAKVPATDETASDETASDESPSSDGAKVPTNSLPPWYASSGIPRLVRLERTAGSVVVHGSDVPHGVTRMLSGTRMSLILFFGRPCPTEDEEPHPLLLCAPSTLRQIYRKDGGQYHCNLCGRNGATSLCGRQTDGRWRWTDEGSMGGVGMYHCRLGCGYDVCVACQALKLRVRAWRHARALSRRESREAGDEDEGANDETSSAS
jgi:hypothetical protein